MRRRGLGYVGVSVGLLVTDVSAGPLDRGDIAHAQEAPRGTSAVRGWAALEQMLAEDAHYHTAPARRVVYTWTTEEQVIALRRDRDLLTRSISPTRGPSGYNQELDAHFTATRSSISRLLRSPGFVRHRFAWSNPWATRLGFPGEEYGNELLRVTLRPSSIVACFQPGTRRVWSFVDLENRPVPARLATTHPERIAAVYHVSQPNSAPRRSPAMGSYTPAPPLGYREFVLVNESMIERWEVASDPIRQRLTRDADMIEQYIRYRLAAPTQPPWSVSVWNGDVVRGVWRSPSEPRTLERLYDANLAFPNEPYYHHHQPTLAPLLAALRGASPRGAPLVHEPNAPFDLQHAEVPRGAPPPPRVRSGTY